MELSEKATRAAEKNNLIQENILFHVITSHLHDDCAPRRAGHACYPDPQPLVTELLQLPVPGYGTVYRHISEMLTYRTVGSGGH